MRDRRDVTVLEVLRRRQGWSQTDVGLATGMTTIRVSNIERGLRPSAEQLTKLRELFGMPETLEYVLLERVPLPSEVPEVPPPPSMEERILARTRAQREAREKKQ